MCCLRPVPYPLRCFVRALFVCCFCVCAAVSCLLFVVVVFWLAAERAALFELYLSTGGPTSWLPAAQWNMTKNINNVEQGHNKHITGVREEIEMRSSNGIRCTHVFVVLFAVVCRSLHSSRCGVHEWREHLCWRSVWQLLAQHQLYTCRLPHHKHRHTDKHRIEWSHKQTQSTAHKHAAHGTQGKWEAGETRRAAELRHMNVHMNAVNGCCFWSCCVSAAR